MLAKHTLNLEKGHYDELKRLHPNISVAEVIRQLINAYITKQREKISADLNVELEIDCDNNS